MIYDISLFIFRRDLRLNDNIGLINCLKLSKKVIPIFILNPEQITEKNKYRSNNCIQFMIESIKELNQELKNNNGKLYIFYGLITDIIEKLINKYNVKSIFVNSDYTPYSINRDNSIQQLCNKHNIDFKQYEDVLLHPIKTIINNDGNVYLKFSPFLNKAKNVLVNKPIKNINVSNKYYNKYIPFTFDNLDSLYEYNKLVPQKGGCLTALKKLKSLKNFKNYNINRNILSINTTLLSAYIKFGCISIRKLYHNIIKILGKNNQLLVQIYWREFYYNVISAYPYILNGENLNPKYNKIPWITWKSANIRQKEMFNKWKNGETGFLIIDAAMNELNKTGYMNNRARMISASFLTKQMMWHWKEGEKYFAQKLYDYDPTLNNLNWQFIAGSGNDSQQFIRIFNPFNQQLKYDKQNVYINKWLKLPLKLPMLDNNKATEKTKKIFKKYLNRN